MKNKKTKKLSIVQVQKKLWQACRRVADILFTKNGVTRCYTCDKVITGSNKQLGHMLPKSTCGMYLKYDVERNLRWQCYHCNINGGGQGAIFVRRMVEEKGQEYVDETFVLRNKSGKAIDFFIELLALYETM